ncbi:hypothetical protein LIER_39637 [Lithospermum erythrorhizon]|uniref:Uncharacterized protein n=1 Tax=Lithospermum erythrorhizon TaxID=34254 RepID=A0AAV3QK57_LITER
MEQHKSEAGVKDTVASDQHSLSLDDANEQIDQLTRKSPVAAKNAKKQAETTAKMSALPLVNTPTSRAPLVEKEGTKLVQTADSLEEVEAHIGEAVIVDDPHTKDGQIVGPSTAHVIEKRAEIRRDISSVGMNDTTFDHHVTLHDAEREHRRRSREYLSNRRANLENDRGHSHATNDGMEYRNERQNPRRHGIRDDQRELLLDVDKIMLPERLPIE